MPIQSRCSTISSDWSYQGKILSDLPGKDYAGFIYIILNKTNGKKYIGKKIFNIQKTIQRKGVKKKIAAESDWVSYTGSNAELNDDIKKGDKIEKIVLSLSHSKSEMGLLETYAIIKSNALVRDDFYNNWVSCKITKRHLQKLKLVVPLQLLALEKDLGHLLQNESTDQVS